MTLSRPLQCRVLSQPWRLNTMDTTTIGALVLTLLSAVVLLLSSRDAVAELAGVLLLSSRDAVAKLAGVTLAAMLPSRESGHSSIDPPMYSVRGDISGIKLKRVISVCIWGFDSERLWSLRRKYGDNFILILHTYVPFDSSPIITDDGRNLTKEKLIRIYSNQVSGIFSEFHFFHGDNLIKMEAGYLVNPELENFVRKLGIIRSIHWGNPEIEVVFYLEDDGNGLKEEHAKKAMKHKCSVP